MTVSLKGPVTPQLIAETAKKFGTPVYLYDEKEIISKCGQMLSMPNAFGLQVRYAMKANSNRTLLRVITEQGLDLDLSSLNEGRRALRAGIPCLRMMLTSQEVPSGKDRKDLEAMIRDGLTYTVCSIRQLEMIADFASRNHVPLSIRVNPGVGAGESVTRNTGDKYSSFGIHLANLQKAIDLAKSKGLVFRQVHVHIGSGGDPRMWRENIDRELDILERFFPDAETINFGGGFKEGRMPDETAANIQELGQYARKKLESFHLKTGRKLKMAIEPGTFIIANAGYIIASVIDEKWSGPGGFEFIVLDAGMESNTRPLLYGSRHPFYVISREGGMLSSEFDLNAMDVELDFRVVVGRCCESGDSQSLDYQGHIIPRKMADPSVGDYVSIGGAGAYCSAMSLSNYNSFLQAPEVLLGKDGSLKLIRSAQTLDQLLQNETDDVK